MLIFSMYVSAIGVGRNIYKTGKLSSSTYFLAGVYQVLFQGFWSNSFITSEPKIFDVSIIWFIIYRSLQEI